jgi:signal transduction histidine kinase
MRVSRRGTLYWAVLSSVAVLCCALAVMQYRWTGELARAERERLRNGLQAALNIVSREFNTELMDACTALQPTAGEIAVQGREQAYSARYQEWRKSTGRSEMFQQLAIAIPANDNLDLRMLDSRTGSFSAHPWPLDWLDLQNALRRHLDRRGPPPPTPLNPFLVEMPRFGGTPGVVRAAEQEWLILELNPEYTRRRLIPELLERNLSTVGALDFEAEVFVRSDPSKLIYRSHNGEPIGVGAEASVTLFDIRPGFERPQGARQPHSMTPTDPGRGRWQLLVRSRGGSLDALVQKTRRRNLTVSGSILALLLASVVLLFRSSKRVQQLADLQMNFVAGVSHELRTPLTVIRTAAFNLRERASRNPEKVERYGKLIEEETEKLTTIVEQVLRFASARGGHVIRERTPVRVESVIEQGIQASRHILDAARCVVETNLQPELPLVLGDEVALRQVVQNLLENAAKYGVDGSKWIGISAENITADRSPFIRIRVSDRGHGIPPEEQEHIFDAFFRGRRALQNQVHGTGLGLNLVRQIVEAHGGTVGVNSDVKQGTEFIVRIPALHSETAE